MEFIEDVWKMIKEYAGIYHIEYMDYKLFRKMEIRSLKNGRMTSYFPYIFHEFKATCNAPSWFYEFNDYGQGLKHALSRREIRKHIHKSLASGYKSEIFYKRMVKVLMADREKAPWYCECGVRCNTLCERAIHMKQHKLISKMRL